MIHLVTDLDLGSDKVGHRLSMALGGVLSMLWGGAGPNAASGAFASIVLFSTARDSWRHAALTILKYSKRKTL